MYRYVLFDLDGTLSDPKVGICTSVQYALDKMGISEPDIDKLEPFIGPPLRDSFKEYYNMSDEEAEQAITYYRERFSTVGKFENELYPGIYELLRDLKKKERVVAIASSKPTVFVEDILNHFEIREFFDVVVGSELDGTRDKKIDVLNETLSQMFGGNEPEYDEVVMVGDRKYDVEAASELGVHNIAVAYGYGSREELEEAGADKIVNTVAGLRTTLLPVLNQAASQSFYSGAQSGPSGKGKTLEELKAERKDAGRKSFANMWGFVGPALMYWIGGLFFYYILVFALFNLFFKDSGEFPYDLEFILFAASNVLVCLFLIRDFKSVIKKSKENPRKKNIFTLKSGLLSLSMIIMGIGLGGVAAAMAKTTAEMALSGEAVEQAVETVSDYSPSFWLGFLVYGLLLPVAQHCVFAGVCYNRAKKYMNKFSILLTAILYGFVCSSTGSGLALTVLMAGALILYELSGSFYTSLGMFVIANILRYVIETKESLGALFYNNPVAAILAAAGLTTAIVINLQENKEER